MGGFKVHQAGPALLGLIPLSRALMPKHGAMYVNGCSVHSMRFGTAVDVASYPVLISIQTLFRGKIGPGDIGGVEAVGFCVCAHVSSLS